MIDSWTKEQFLQVMSDAHKTAFGIRPHNTNYNDWSISTSFYTITAFWR